MYSDCLLQVGQGRKSAWCIQTVCCRLDGGESLLGVFRLFVAGWMGRKSAWCIQTGCCRLDGEKVCLVYSDCLLQVGWGESLPGVFRLVVAGWTGEKVCLVYSDCLLQVGWGESLPGVFRLFVAGWTGEKVCLVGDSAGANLVMSASMRAASYGVRCPDGIVSVYGCMLVEYIPSPARMLTLMDPLLPLGILSKCLAGKYRVSPFCRYPHVHMLILETNVIFILTR